MTPADPTPNGLIALIIIGFLVALTITILWPLFSGAILVLIVFVMTVSAVVQKFKK